MNLFVPQQAINLPLQARQGCTTQGYRGTETFMHISHVHCQSRHRRRHHPVIGQTGVRHDHHRRRFSRCRSAVRVTRGFSATAVCWIRISSIVPHRSTLPFADALCKNSNHFKKAVRRPEFGTAETRRGLGTYCWLGSQSEWPIFVVNASGGDRSPMMVDTTWAMDRTLSTIILALVLAVTFADIQEVHDGTHFLLYIHII
jgi:hypothetical protein